MTGSTILVADDSRTIRVQVRQILTTAGFDVVEASTGQEALEQIEEQHPSLAIIDINMPEVKGDEICRRLRETPGFEQLPVFIFSSLSDEELLELSTRSGANGYVSKQHGLERLRDYLQELSKKGVL